MSTCSYLSGFADAFVGDHTPGASEEPEAGNIQMWNWWINSSNNDLFQCLDNTPSAMVWLRRSRVPLSYSQPTFSNITTATQLSTLRDARVNYSFPYEITGILGGRSITATLQYADDSGMTTNVITVDIASIGFSGLTTPTSSGNLQVSGAIPAGKYRKVTLSETGSATVPTTIDSSQEVLL